MPPLELRLVATWDAGNPNGVERSTELSLPHRLPRREEWVPAGRMQLGVDNWLVKGLFCFATKGNMDVLSKNTRSTHGMCYGESLYVKGTIHHPCVNYYID